MNDEMAYSLSLVEQLATHLNQHGLKLVTAESCTGGWVAQTLTSVPGSSAWFERGFVTYSTDAKIECLGVEQSVIDTHGVVSKETAEAMADGALKNSHADIALSITGIAGPGGGTEQIPVGLVCFAFSGEKINQSSEIHHLDGDRFEVRQQATQYAISRLLQLVSKVS